MQVFDVNLEDEVSDGCNRNSAGHYSGAIEPIEYTPRASNGENLVFGEDDDVELYQKVRNSPIENEGIFHESESSSDGSNCQEDLRNSRGLEFTEVENPSIFLENEETCATLEAVDLEYMKGLRCKRT